MFSNYGVAPSSSLSQLSAARAGLEELAKIAGEADKKNVDIALARQRDLEAQGTAIDPNNAEYMGRFQAAIEKQLQQVSILNDAIYSGKGTKAPDVSRVTSIITGSKSGRGTTGGALVATPGDMTLFGSSDTIFGINKWIVYGVGGVTAALLLTMMIPKKSSAAV
jgi:hypothetical protein